ncbi:MAG: methylene-tetrahydromethanopterin dehydrogenase N-terminal domain-containing protein, partial [Candidatus Methylumidiphilus sp.]
MAIRSIIHMFDPMPHNSPFDLNMAADAGFEVLLPYSNVKLAEVHGLVQDAIFSRGPTGVKRTGIFIGGRDINDWNIEELRRRVADVFQETFLFSDTIGWNIRFGATEGT